MTTTNRTKICNYIAVGLMALLLLVQFTPYWQHDGGSTSLLGYVYMPADHPEFEAWVEASTGTLDVNGIVNGPIVMFLLLVVGIVVCVVKNEYWPAGLAPIAVGAAGFWAYLQPVARLGASWGLHVTLCAAIFVFGALACIPKKKA